MTAHIDQNERPPTDSEIVAIAEYIIDDEIECEQAVDAARYALLDALGCAFRAYREPECTKHLGPLALGTIVPHGARVPGSLFELDPVKAAFDISALIGWLNLNDSCLAVEISHPSDNIGAILAVADYVSRQNVNEGYDALSMRDVLLAMIKAYEIHGALAQHNSFHQAGMDHVVLVKLSSAALATAMLGGNREDVENTISQVWLDGQALYVYRQASEGYRQCWAAADAASRGVRLALMTMSGEKGYPTALSATGKGFFDVQMKGERLNMPPAFSCHVIQNLQFHLGQAAEAGMHNAHEPPSAQSLDDEQVMNMLLDKFRTNVATRFPAKHARDILDLCLDKDEFEATPVNEFMNLLMI